MVGSVTFAPASEFSLEQVTLAFNIGFTGYYLPMTQTPAGLAEMMRENDVQLNASLALLVNGALAGIGLVALRGERGWIAGMGVGPQWRQQGLGRQLLTRLLDNLRVAGAHAVQLEALSVNTPALALYTSMGFHDNRELRVYQGQLRLSDDQRAWGDGVGGARPGPVSPQVALSDFPQFHQVAPAWQREARTLWRMRRDFSGLGLWDGARLRAYVIYTRQPDGIVIFDAGASDSAPGVRRSHLVALLTYLAPRREEAVVRAINTPPGDALDDALAWLKCPVVARQREMSRAL